MTDVSKSIMKCLSDVFVATGGDVPSDLLDQLKELQEQLNRLQRASQKVCCFSSSNT